MIDRLTPRYGFFLLLACAVGLGAYLRLTMLHSQILLDDEWHGLNQVIDASLGEVLTGFDGKDNTSMPLNVYDWALLHTFGWTETGIRLPVVVAGLMGLFLMPLAWRKISGNRSALIFAFFLAISPFAVFYSRFSRAYIIIMLLCYLALLFAHRWLATGKRGAAAGFVLTGTMAVYSHPLSVIVTAVPFVVYYTRGSRAGGVVGVPAGDVRKFGVIQAALLIPVGWMVLSAGSRMPWGEGAWSMNGLGDAFTLLSGTVNIPWNIIFYSLLIAGSVALARKDPLLGRIFLATLLLSVAALAISMPFGLGTGIVVLRYMIVVVPVALSTVAAGIDFSWERIPGAKGPFGTVTIRLAGATLAGATIAGLVAAGPLPAVYTAPNNFTNHSAYQGSYEPPDPSRSDSRHVYPGFSIMEQDVPEFYRKLRTQSEVGAIVEYPLDVTNYNNLYYFYQRVHGKRVIAGYSTNRELLGHRAEIPPGDGKIPLRLGMLTADQILSHAADPAALKFTNMVDVLDPAALKRSGAGVLVIHKNIMALRFLPDGGHDAVRVWYRSAAAVAERCVRAFGPPLYEDSAIICFRVGR